jgi:hypothetical protein
MKIIVQWPKWLIKAVTGIKKRLVEKVTKPCKAEIFILVEGGVVHEIINLPPNINVTVIDYDIESVEDRRLEISPVDGELCVINKW